MTVLVDELTLILLLFTHSLSLLPRTREPLRSKRDSADELLTCYSTRDGFWPADLKWFLKMKVTMVCYEIRF